MPHRTPAAGRHTARQAIAAVADDFTELPSPATPHPDNPLAWPGYDELRRQAHERTGETESIVCGTATIGGSPAMLLSLEFGFLGGSLGVRTGDRIEAAHTAARERRLPLVTLIATGGSRLQEGMLALGQLQRIAAQSAMTRAAGLAQIAVACDPTTGGGWATLGAGADIILAEPSAQIGFAGSRVRPAGADPAAYSAEAQLAAGHIDAIVAPEELAATLGRWLRLLRPPADAAPADPPRALGKTALPETGWQAVLHARDAARPRARDYLRAYFDGGYEEIRGDRCGGVDDGMLCGFGLRGGRPIAFAAQCGTATRPAGFRTATRLLRMASRLGIPILTLIDTPGASNDAEAERGGIGAAIAQTYAAVAEARVPITSVVIGEGTSGGALALAAPGNLWATPDSYFTVLAPEAAAAVLKRGAEGIAQTASDLKIRPQDLLKLGIIRGIVDSAD
ncbi:MAG TPA: carboxyl transferase domain-containing protein [Candidatus Limnocylindrales bacterium]|nr:carboxyl transferase domain-containing protein [Candidatus Limnocylindrales bacterium]